MTDVMTPDYCEAQYNPRLRVANVPEIAGAWTAAAAAARAAPAVTLNLSVGPHDRDLVDVFRPDGASRGAVLFYHCGNWIRFSKDAFSWVANAFTAAGYTAVIVNYPVCPQNTLPEIAAATRASFARIWTDVLNDAERAHLIPIGHSAGGFLVADLFTVDWRVHGLPATPFRAALCVSGLYELAPLTLTEANAEMGLTEAITTALSLTGKQPLVTAPLLLAVAEDDFDGFKSQSARLLAAWPQTCLEPVISVAGANHFTVADALLPDGALAARVLAALARPVA